MSGLFGKKAVASTEPALGALNIQTSIYGLTIPVIFGRARVPINLLWYNGFRALAQEERSETGKGGASPPSRVYYTYSADVILGVGIGPATAVRTIWKGKQRFSGAAESTTFRSVTETSYVPADPYQVTVSGTWSADVRVIGRAIGSGEDPDLELIAGVHYVVSSGTYTFDSSLYGKIVTIMYLVEEVAASQDALAQLGMVLETGTYSQSIWSRLTDTYPDEALAYPGIAVVHARDYPLTSSAEVENHTFEVDGALSYSSTVPDCDPSKVVEAILTDRFVGVNLPASKLGDLTVFSDYCLAYGLFISPVFNEQRQVRDWLEPILEATNTDILWDGEKIQFLPRGDEDAGDYEAPNIPVFSFTDDDFLGEGADPPVRVERVSERSVKNIFRVEYRNRDNDYNLEVVEYRDEALELQFGRKVDDSRSWDFIKDGQVARMATMILGQRQSACRAKYTFKLFDTYVELMPGDLIELTSSGLPSTYARVQRITEGDDEIEVEAEEFPVAHANAPLVPVTLGTGFIPNWNADPGDVNDPVFVEAPGSSTPSGLEVLCAASGDSEFWGGCDVYASTDGGSSYKHVATIDQRARAGVIRASSTAGAGPIKVELNARAIAMPQFGGVDAATGRSLCYVGDSTTGEFFAYESAQLVGAQQWDLYGLQRAFYGTDDVAHDADEPFTLVDASLGSSGPLDEEMVGKTIYFKFVSFNVFGGGVQSLADVSAYPYTITGRFRWLRKQSMPNNRIQNADFYWGIDDWTLDRDSVSSANVSLTLSTANGREGSLVGRNKAALLSLVGDGIVSGIQRFPAAVAPERVAVKAGDWVSAGAQLWTQYGRAAVELRFYSETTLLSQAFSEYSTAQIYTPLSLWADLANYETLSVFAQAPTGATSVEFRVRLSEPTGSTLGAFIAEPQLNVAGYRLTELPPWSAGPDAKTPLATMAGGSFVRMETYTWAGGAMTGGSYYLGARTPGFTTQRFTQRVRFRLEATFTVTVPTSTIAQCVLSIRPVVGGVEQSTIHADGPPVPPSTATSVRCFVEGELTVPAGKGVYVILENSYTGGVTGTPTLTNISYTCEATKA